LLLSRRDLAPNLLGRLPPHPLFSRSNPPSGLLGCLTSNPLARFVDRGGNAPPNLLGRLPPYLLLSRSNAPFSLCGCFLPHLLFKDSNLPGRLLRCFPSSVLARLLNRGSKPVSGLLSGLASNRLLENS
jgi:hypothetical protein